VPHFNSVFQRWKCMGCLIHCAVDSRKSNIEFEAVHKWTRCSKIKQAYEVLSAKWTRKILCKNILTLHRYRDFFVLGHFIVTHPVDTIHVEFSMSPRCGQEGSTCILYRILGVCIRSQQEIWVHETRENALKHLFLEFKVVQGHRCWYSRKGRQQCLLWCVASLCLSSVLLLVDRGRNRTFWRGYPNLMPFNSTANSLNLGGRKLHC